MHAIIPLREHLQNLVKTINLIADSRNSQLMGSIGFQKFRQGAEGLLPLMASSGVSTADVGVFLVHGAHARIAEVRHALNHFLGIVESRPELEILKVAIAVDGAAKMCRQATGKLVLAAKMNTSAKASVTHRAQGRLAGVATFSANATVKRAGLESDTQMLCDAAGRPRHLQDVTRVLFGKPNAYEDVSLNFRKYFLLGGKNGHVDAGEMLGFIPEPAEGRELVIEYTDGEVNRLKEGAQFPRLCLPFQNNIRGAFAISFTPTPDQVLRFRSLTGSAIELVNILRLADKDTFVSAAEIALKIERFRLPENATPGSSARDFGVRAWSSREGAHFIALLNKLDELWVVLGWGRVTLLQSPGPFARLPTAQLLDEIDQAATTFVDKPTAAPFPSPKATHNEDFTSVDWYGTLYTFKVGQQAQVVKVLWEAMASGKPTMALGSIAEKIGSTAESNFKLSAIFRNHPAFKKIFFSTSKGVYRLADRPLDSLKNLG